MNLVNLYFLTSRLQFWNLEEEKIHDLLLLLIMWGNSQLIQQSIVYVQSGVESAHNKIA